MAYARAQRRRRCISSPWGICADPNLASLAKRCHFRTAGIHADQAATNGRTRKERARARPCRWRSEVQEADDRQGSQRKHCFRIPRQPSPPIWTLLTQSTSWRGRMTASARSPPCSGTTCPGRGQQCSPLVRSRGLAVARRTEVHRRTEGGYVARSAARDRIRRPPAGCGRG